MADYSTRRATALGTIAETGGRSTLPSRAATRQVTTANLREASRLLDEAAQVETTAKLVAYDAPLSTSVENRMVFDANVADAIKNRQQAEANFVAAEAEYNTARGNSGRLARGISTAKAFGRRARAIGGGLLALPVRGYEKAVEQLGRLPYLEPNPNPEAKGFFKEPARRVVQGLGALAGAGALYGVYKNYAGIGETVGAGIAATTAPAVNAFTNAAHRVASGITKTTGIGAAPPVPEVGVADYLNPGYLAAGAAGLAGLGAAGYAGYQYYKRRHHGRGSSYRAPTHVVEDIGLPDGSVEEIAYDTTVPLNVPHRRFKRRGVASKKSSSKRHYPSAPSPHKHRRHHYKKSSRKSKSRSKPSRRRTH